MAKKGLSKPIPPDTYELRHALGQVKKISVRQVNHSDKEPRVSNTTTSIGEVNVTINNAPNTPNITTENIGGYLTEADIELRLTNVELKYTKSQISFQKDIHDEIDAYKESTNEAIGKKVSKEFIYWVAGISIPILLSILGYYFFEIHNLKNDVSIIRYELEKNNQTQTVKIPKSLDSISVTKQSVGTDSVRINK